MSSPTQEQVQQSLEKLQDPETGRTLKKQISEVTVDGNSITAKIGLTSFAMPIKEIFQQEVTDHLQKEFSGASTTVEIVDHVRPATPKGQIGLKAKAVIAVAAGKGGVGKSTAATTLAMGLKRAGCSVGLLDADVYGPSLPHLTGTRGQVTKGARLRFRYSG